MKITIGELKHLMNEVLLTEAEGKENGETSLDAQVDRLLENYESTAKKSITNVEQMEAMDWRDLIKGRLIETHDEGKQFINGWTIGIEQGFQDGYHVYAYQGRPELYGSPSDALPYRFIKSPRLKAKDVSSVLAAAEDAAWSTDPLERRQRIVDVLKHPSLSEGNINEADDENSDDKSPKKLTEDDIDVETFANDVARLIDNYDNLLEVSSTLARRAAKYISKNYDEATADKLLDVLREQHGIVPGMSKSEFDDEEFVAPNADRAGSNVGGAGR